MSSSLLQLKESSTLVVGAKDWPGTNPDGWEVAGPPGGQLELCIFYSLRLGDF